MLAGACLLVLIFTITECKLTLDITKRQIPNCGNQTDPNTELGKCSQAADDEDVDTLCDGCYDVLEKFFNC